MHKEQNNKTIVNRIEWIDHCKALAIFAMVFAHCGLRMQNTDKSIDEWIHLWHMPIFFILSGMVLNSYKWLGWSNFRKYLISRFKLLIVPFLFYGTIWNLWILFILNVLQIGGG